MSPHRLTAKGERTRQRVLAAASELIFERGVAGTTIEDVQAAAGVSASQLYHYFPSKNALVRAVIQFQEEGVVGAQEQALAHLDTVDGLRATGLGRRGRRSTAPAPLPGWLPDRLSR